MRLCPIINNAFIKAVTLFSILLWERPLLDSAFTKLVDVNAEVKQLVTGCQFTEGPVWNPTAQAEIEAVGKMMRTQ